VNGATPLMVKYSKHLANIIEIFTTEFRGYLYIVCKNLWKFNVKIVFLWPPYVIGQAIIFLPCGFFFLLFFPHLISAVKYSKHLANIIEIFTTEFRGYLYIVCKNLWKFNVKIVFLWPPYVIGPAIIFLPCGFFFLLFFPHLISAVGDWTSTILPHMVWP